MRDNTAEDAVGHFSANAAEFDSYYRSNPEFHERLDLWQALLDRYSTPGGLSLDMGCGSGVFTFYLAGKGGRVVGVDGAANMIALCEETRRARGLDNIRFMQATLPVVDEAALAGADLLISSSVIEYVADLDATLAMFARLLKPGGTMILSMPNALCINRNYERAKFRLLGKPEIYRHIRHFSSPQRLARRAAPLGFTLKEHRFYTHFTRLARLTRAVGLPPVLTEDLFVAVFAKARG